MQQGLANESAHDEVLWILWAVPDRRGPGPLLNGARVAVVATGCEFLRHSGRISTGYAGFKTLACRPAATGVFHHASVVEGALRRIESRVFPHAAQLGEPGARGAAAGHVDGSTVVGITGDVEDLLVLAAGIVPALDDLDALQQSGILRVGLRIGHGPDSHLGCGRADRWCRQISPHWHPMLVAGGNKILACTQVIGQIKATEAAHHRAGAAGAIDFLAS